MSTQLPLDALRAFAISRHGEQRYGAAPYVTHLDHVLAVVRRHGLGVEFERAAYGHDLLDDTATTRAELGEIFGQVEAALIDAVSGTGANRAARRADTVQRLHAHPAAINLKAADRIANLSTSLEQGNVAKMAMYLDEGPAYAPLFAMAKPSLAHELGVLYARARAALGRSPLPDPRAVGRLHAQPPEMEQGMSLLNLTGQVIAMGVANAEDLAAINGKPRLLIELADDQVVMVAGLTREQVRAVAPAFLERVFLAVSQ